ncbi:MAG: PASTA domain-containing protein [Bacteroidales bacterium]|nr:PASTA domain-containing protein [Bacteroidales bacterium]
MSNKILSNWIVKNLLIALGVVLGIVVAINILLNLYTHHGEKLGVPDFTNLTVEEAQELADSAGLKIEIEDSVFVKKMKKGAIFSQTPKPGSAVKSGRRIMLITNAKTAQKVMMPNVVDRPVRTARSELSAKGLNIGKLVFVDASDNNVVRQLYRGRVIKPGTMIDSGSDIVLEVGLQQEDCYTTVPNVIGKKYLNATNTINDYSLNVGRVKFDSSVRDYTDSLNAVVYAQGPENPRTSVMMGEKVNITLTVDPAKMPKEK